MLSTMSKSSELPRRTLLTGALGTAVGGLLLTRPSAAQATTTLGTVVGDWFELVVELGAPPPGSPFGGGYERVPANCWLSALAAVTEATSRPGFEDAAVATAVHNALAALRPDQTGRLATALEISLAAIQDSAGKQAGIQAGRDAATRTLRKHGPNAPGVYRLPPDATEPGGYDRGLPFLLGRADRFRPGPPPAIGSKLYRRDLEELRRFGGEVSARTERQSDIAFLAPQRQYTPALRALVTDPDRPVSWKVRLLAAYATATADAGLAVSDGKTTYQHWRPVTAIQAADPEANWRPYLRTPANPEWPSGHGGFAGAAEQVFEHFTGPRTPVAFTATYRRDDGKVVNLEYPRGTPWSVLTQDNVDARVWAGVHFRFSDEAGATLGRRVGAYNLRRLDRAFA